MLGRRSAWWRPGPPNVVHMLHQRPHILPCLIGGPAPNRDVAPLGRGVVGRWCLPCGPWPQWSIQTPGSMFLCPIAMAEKSCSCSEVPFAGDRCGCTPNACVSDVESRGLAFQSIAPGTPHPVSPPPESSAACHRGERSAPKAAMSWLNVRPWNVSASTRDVWPRSCAGFLVPFLGNVAPSTATQTPCLVWSGGRLWWPTTSWASSHWQPLKGLSGVGARCGGHRWPPLATNQPWGGSPLRRCRTVSIVHDGTASG